MIDKGVYGKRFLWNPSDCECYKSCDFSEYLDHKNCKCKKRLVDKLVEKCTENIEETRVEITSAELNSKELHSAKNENKHKCSSCTLCIVLFSILFTINVGIGTYFVYFNWYLKKMLFVLSLVPVLKQQFNKCNSIELVDGKSQTK